MRRSYFITLLTVLFICCLPVAAKKISGFSSTKGEQSGFITFVVTSIDYRSDLTRVYGKITGKPHTSERIDELVIVTPSGRQYKCTDIDGVDMKRWFQWEDDGSIDMELDFPVMKPVNSFTIKSKGPKGESVTKIRKK